MSNASRKNAVGQHAGPGQEDSGRDLQDGDARSPASARSGRPKRRWRRGDRHRLAVRIAPATWLVLQVVGEFFDRRRIDDRDRSGLVDSQRNRLRRRCRSDEAIGDRRNRLAPTLQNLEWRIGDGKTAKISQSLVVETCCSCGIVFAMPIELYRERTRDRKNFHCPNGHPQHYVTSAEQDLRNQVAREQAKADQLRADRDRERRSRQRAERQRSALKGQLTKVKKRVAHGVCPCCNRTFQNLQRHMESQHPEFEASPE